jgi:WD40 repeat protein
MVGVPDSIICGTSDGQLLQIHVHALNAGPARLATLKAAVVALAVSADRRTLAALDAFGNGAIIDATSAKVIRRFDCKPGRTAFEAEDKITCAGFSPDLRQVLITDTNRLMLFGTKSADDSPSSLPRGLPDAAEQVAWSKSGAQAWIHGGKMFLAVPGGKVSSCDVDSGSHGSLRFSDSGEDLAVDLDNRTMQFFGAQPLKERWRIQAPGLNPFMFLFLDDDTRIASYGFNWGVTIWDTRTFKQVLDLSTGRRSPVAAAFSPDESLLMCACEGDGHVFLWHAATEAEVERWTKDWPSSKSE